MQFVVVAAVPGGWQTAPMPQQIRVTHTTLIFRALTWS
jgi:hypothetical protein